MVEAEEMKSTKGGWMVEKGRVSIKHEYIRYSRCTYLHSCRWKCSTVYAASSSGITTATYRVQDMCSSDAAQSEWAACEVHAVRLLQVSRDWWYVERLTS